MQRAWIWCVMVAACISDPTVPCGDLHCRAHDVCTRGGCAAPENVAACEGKPDAAACSSPSIVNGACAGDACHPITCGDGTVDPGEVCDPPDPGHGCSATCESTEVCGNAFVDVAQGEECDSGIAALSGDGCSSVCKIEHAAWRDVTPQTIPGRGSTAIAYDRARDRIVLFGGATLTNRLGDTWELDAQGWHPKFPITSPPAREAALMFYDAVRARVVLIGGNGDSGVLGDQWEWDGTTWTEQHPAVSPSPRYGAAVAYDTTRGVAVLFGGFDAMAGEVNDTWEWNGAWTQIQPATSPPARVYHAMTHDSVRNRIVLYGGLVSGATPRDTWEYDGSTWVQLSPATTPSTTHVTAMAYDPLRQRTMMLGGYESCPGPTCGSPSSVVWEWSGTDWASVPASGPLGRVSAGVVYDDAMQRIVVFGGTYNTVASTLAYDDTWAWNGSAWTALPNLPINPIQRYGLRTVYDSERGEVILFAGLNYRGGQLYGDTWRWDGHVWTDAAPSSAPPARYNHALAFDQARGVAVLFGGKASIATGDVQADTWEWDGAMWTQRSPALSPPARSNAAMTYDSARRRVVLFGGWNGSITFADTWEWDGTTWTDVTPTVSPPARYSAALAYDAVRQRVVLFGGYYTDTWEWDGTTWTERFPTTSPAPRVQAGMIYDAQRQRVLLFGGAYLDAYADAWEWDGTTWAPMFPVTAAPARSNMTLAYDAARRQTVMFGGLNLVGAEQADTWILQWESEAMAERCLTTTLDDDLDGRRGCDDPDCWGRCAPRCPPGAPCAATDPRCGDGVCAPIEDRALCPVDCP